MRRIAMVLICAVMSVVLASCLSFIQEGSLLPGGGITTDELPVITVVYPQAVAPHDNPYPLFAGAEWVYRNASNDFNPEVHPASLLASQVLGSVYCVDTDTGNAWECYAVRAADSGNSESIDYLHRRPEGVYRFSKLLHDNTVDFPGYLFLPNPLIQDTYVLHNVPQFDGQALWEQAVSCTGDRNSLDVGGGGDCSAGSEVVSLTVLYCSETVGLSKVVDSVLGGYTALFTDAWKLEMREGIEQYPDYQWWATSSDLAWLAPGIGVVKWVKGSSSLELISFVREEEILALSSGSESKWHNSALGSRIVLQFRGTDPESADPATWRIVDNTGLSPTNEAAAVVEQSGARAFYHDIDTEGQALHSGTYVYTFEANQLGYATLQFEPNELVELPGQTVFRIKVGEFNSLPIALDDEFDIDANAGELTLDVLENDYDIDPTDYIRISEIAMPPSQGTAYILDGRLMYESNQGFVGWDFFTYVIEDRQGATAEAMIRVRVAEGIDSP